MTSLLPSRGHLLCLAWCLEPFHHAFRLINHHPHHQLRRLNYTVDCATPRKLLLFPLPPPDRSPLSA